MPESVGRTYAIMDNLRVHKVSDVLLFSLAHSRWEFVFHPKYAAYLNLTRAVVEDAEIFSHQGALLRGLEADRGGHNAGRRLLWSAHRHPSFWRRRRRHRAVRRPGVGAICLRYRRWADENAANLANDPAAIVTLDSHGRLG